MSKDKDVIVSLIAVEGASNPAVEVMKSKDAPVIQAVGMFCIPGSNQWVSYTADIQGTKLLKLEVSEPNLRLIAADDLKTAVVLKFLDADAV